MSYRDSDEFWNRTTPTTMGDIINRPAAIQLLGDLSGKRVWEAGCGNGYFARMLAREGARVSGLDMEPRLINMAEAMEQEQRLGIAYRRGNIAVPPYPDDSFDIVTCISVLMHCDLMSIERFLLSAMRTLRPSGKLLISIPHPSLYTEGSAARNDVSNWINLVPKDEPADDFGSQRFTEHYVNTAGRVFTAPVWHHPTHLYLNALMDAGFRIERIQEPLITAEAAGASPHWGAPWGYPGYLQILCAS